MNQEAYCVPNPNAPRELSHFAFLIGKWQCEGKFRYEGASSAYRITWVGRYIMDGYAIADDARVFDDEGALERSFITYRFYDLDRKRWIIDAFNVLESTMVHQAPDDLGGVQVSEASITLMTRGPTAVGRESFLNISKEHFTYRLDVSTDEGVTWIEGVDLIEANRVSE